MFFINGRGVEKTTQFALENWWITDYASFENSTITDFTIQAVERSIILQIDHCSQAELLSAHPQLERYFRTIFQRAYAASQIRMKYINEFSREEFYLHFSRNFPVFVERIPQNLLASFLNMTPEYLSEIKKSL